MAHYLGFEDQNIHAYELGYARFMNEAEYQNILSESAYALAGAEYLKEKLLALASIGPSSLYENQNMFAIKVRAKSVHSLANKVVEKRKKKPAYKATDATDLVGMRFLALHAADLPIVTRTVLSFIRLCQSPDIKIIKGEKLDEAIHEIIVYKSDRNERIYDNVFKDIVRLRLSPKNCFGEKKVDCIMYDGVDKSYSSIHVVCHGQAFNAGVFKDVFIEIQIRTVLEDVWGEIDHKLEYKLKQQIGGDVPQEHGNLHRHVRSLLNNLKIQLEQAGSQAEDARSGYQLLMNSLGLAKQEIRPYEFHYLFRSEGFEKRIFPKSTKNKEWNAAFSEVIRNAEMLRKVVASERIDRSRFNALQAEIERHQARLAGLLELISNQADVAGSSLLEDVSYYVEMEKALCFVWLHLLNSHFNPSGLEQNMSFLAQAQEIYLRLEKGPKFRNDVFVNFRLGIAFAMFGMTRHAEDFVTKAATQLYEIEQPVVDKAFEFVIPHYASYIVWTKRSELLEMGSRIGNPLVNRDGQLDVVVEALTFELVSWVKFRQNNTGGDYDHTHFELSLSNNTICYVWEIWDLVRNEAEFDEVLREVGEGAGMLVNAALELDLNDLKTFIVTHMGDEAKFDDTLLKFYHMTGDAEQCRLHCDNLSRRITKDRQPSSSDDRYDLFRASQPYDSFKYALERASRRENTHAMAVHLRVVPPKSEIAPRQT